MPLPALADDFAQTMADFSALARRDRVDLRLPPLFSPFELHVDGKSK